MTRQYIAGIEADPVTGMPREVTEDELAKETAEYGRGTTKSTASDPIDRIPPELRTYSKISTSDMATGEYKGFALLPSGMNGLIKIVRIGAPTPEEFGGVWKFNKAKQLIDSLIERETRNVKP